jgi:hypothetical protein
MPRKPETRSIKLELRKSAWEALESMVRIRTANDKAAGKIKPYGRVTLTMVITQIVNEFIADK